MSTLEGGRDHRLVFPVSNPYGAVLPGCARLELEGAMDIAVAESGDIAYVAGRDALSILDVAQPQRPLLLGQLQGIGNGRQVEVQGGLAAVTSRPDGLFLCDVRDPRRPKLLCHYDTVELATGVCLASSLCLVACRHFGVELLDIADPARPMHLSNVLAGEAQSVFVDGATMYVGAWMQREVQLFDIGDPARPQALSACLLDGFADGMFVRDHLCFAATGHHARRLVNRRKYTEYDFVTAEMLQEGFGGGHGLEIWDVADPRSPRCLSRIKTPPLFVSGNDLWDVTVSGEHALLADTYNGVFVVHVADPTRPYFEGYRRLDVCADVRYRREPAIQQLCDPVGGIALVEGHALAVSPFSGLHVFKMPAGTKTPPRPAHQDIPRLRPVEPPAETVFRTNGQVHGLAFAGHHMVVAAGDQGLYVLEREQPYAVVEHVQTDGFALDVKTDGDLLYVAEGMGGLAMHRLEAGRLVEVSRHRYSGVGESARQVVLLGETGLAAVHLGINKIAFMDLRSSEAPLCLATFSVGGNMYYKSIADGLLQGRYAAVVPLVPGVVWYDVRAPIHPVEASMGAERQICPIEEGIAIGEQGVYTIFRGKCFFAEGIGPIPPEDEALAVRDAAGRDVEGLYLSGRPVLMGSTLCLLNRQTGLLTMLDVTDPRHPVLTTMRTLRGHPERIVPYEGAYWVCCGHEGLLHMSI